MSSEPRSKSPPAAPTTSRRSLVLGTAVGACALAAIVGGPTITLALAPLCETKSGGARARWVPTVKLDQLEEGKPRRVAIVDDRRDAWMIERNVELGSAWLVRQGDIVLAFSAVCPHLGCSVNAVGERDATGGGFACPCHTSAFDASGKRTSGPAPRDLDALATKIEDGVVSVDFRRFRIGIESKVET